jgi:hypothetical protein
MTSKSDYTTDEWNQILRLPGMVGAFIITSSMSGPLQLAREMLAIGSTIAETAQAEPGSELVGALVADIKAGVRPENDPSLAEIKDNAQARQALLEASRAGMAIVRSKAPGAEAQAFKGWLLAIAHKVAEAGKEGGFLGFGGTSVNEAETSALAELDAALGASSGG